MHYEWIVYYKGKFVIHRFCGVCTSKTQINCFLVFTYRRRRAQERQKKLMAEFANQQKEFMEKVISEFSGVCVCVCVCVLGCI